MSASISEEDWSAMMDKDEAFDYLTLGVEQVTSNEDQSRPTLGAEQEVQTEVVEVDNEQVKLTPHRCSKGCKETSPPLPPPPKKNTLKFLTPPPKKNHKFLPPVIHDPDYKLQLYRNSTNS